MTTVIDCSVPLPRYTSYPPANRWKRASFGKHKEALQNVKEEPISLYIHVPFCDRRCLFCGCFTVASKNEKIKETYLMYLKKEIDLLKNFKSQLGEVVQVHFGGGTPTSLGLEGLGALIRQIKIEFSCAKDMAMSVELDPRTLSSYRDMQELRELGFTRISLGVQDFDAKVQKAIGRIQPEEHVCQVVSWARSSQFDSINMDLIYGLPCQTFESFTQTLNTLLKMDPDRIALFSFAYVPQIRSHQYGLPMEFLPSEEEKMQFFSQAKKTLEKSGYISIGMDHFSKPHDGMARAFRGQTLTRNFQGYDLGLSKTLVGLGMSAISSFEEGYFQNTKDLTFYQKLIEDGCFPVVQGHIFSQDDKMRKWTISKIMCGYGIDKKQFSEMFSLNFDEYFQREIEKLYKQISHSLFMNDDNILKILDEGKFFLQEIACIFDAIAFA